MKSNSSFNKIYLNSKYCSDNCRPSVIRLCIMDGKNVIAAKNEESEEFCSPPLPDTQLAEEVMLEHLSLSLETDDDFAWGWLHAIGDIKFEPVALSNSKYTFGRSQTCDIKIQSHVKENMVSTISKNQFKIFKETLSQGVKVVQLQDDSLNGTFVNRVIVGKGKKVTLVTNDKISISNPNTEVYRYVESATHNGWIPEEMKIMYTVITSLGNGAFGEVKLAKNKATGRSVAIKKIQIKEGKEKKAYNEFKILQDLKHPCIVTLEDLYDTEDSLFIVLEYVRGGELATWIRQVNRLSDAEAKSVCYQLTLALQYLHGKGVAHRDLKPENVLLSGSSAGGERLIKVADFGLSKLVDSKTNLRSFCGTPLYTAPEILRIKGGQGSYTHQVDVWSLGVIMFLCLSGDLPFSRQRSKMPVTEQIIRGMYSQGGVAWRGVSSQAASLVRHMLQVDPQQRFTVQMILQHAWMQDDLMRTKVNQLMDKAQVNDENVCPASIFHQAKRQRLDEETVFKSCGSRPQ